MCIMYLNLNPNPAWMLTQYTLTVQSKFETGVTPNICATKLLQFRYKAMLRDFAHVIEKWH